jgi:predicted RNase H-like HicB family nuclease
MDQRVQVVLTAVYLQTGDGYVGFIEELPGVNAYGHTLEEAREMLRRLAAVVFDEERRGAEEMITGLQVVREAFNLEYPLH